MASIDRNFGYEVCEALGLIGKNVIDLTIKVPQDDIVTIEITMLMGTDQSYRLSKVLKKYKLKEISSLKFHLEDW